MHEITTLGSRIQAARLVAGFTQRELAKRARVSLSLITKLEQGERDSAALETLNKLAGPLGVTTAHLAAEGAAAEPAIDGDVSEWEAVRQAALGNHRDDPGTGVTLAGARGALADLVPLVLASRYTEVRDLLPPLLRDCDALVADGSGHDDALRVRSTARQLAAYMMGQTWQLDTARSVLRLAADDAAGDPGTEQAARSWLAWILLRSGDLDRCASLVSDWADRTEPRMSRASLTELAAWGRLQLYLATCAARDSRPGEAMTSLRWARAAAAAAGRDYIPAHSPWDVFGPVTVEMAAAEVAVVQGRAGETLRITERLDTSSVPVPRNVLRSNLDVARALATAPASSGLRDQDKAVRVLQGVAAAAPQWLAQQRGAADTLQILMDRRRKISREVADLARLLRLVP